MSEFNATFELSKLQTETKRRRKKSYASSRLDKYKGELLLLYRTGATRAELQRWLLSHRIKVNWTTVDRWIKKHG